jgi:biofilm protein TabA
MIVTDLKHIDRQVAMTPALRRAFEFLRGNNIYNLLDGKIEIVGDRVFALVQRYETLMADIPKFEFHRKYVDIQYIVSGEEVIGWIPVGRMTITEAYDSDKDICFGTAVQRKWTPVHLQAGQLAVIYPEDGHAPKLASGAPSSVVKIVVKVAV